MTSSPQPPEVRGPSNGASLQTAILMLGLVLLVAMLALPTVVEKMQYARVRGEMKAIRDAAAVRELAPVGKLFTTLARLIGPTVVNVTGKRRVVPRADEIAALRSNDVSRVTDEEIGSGVIVAADGVIVTNNHVVADATEIDVTLADGRRFVATLLGSDGKTDLAVLRIEATNLPTATWADSDKVEVGEMAWAIGNPYGLDRTLTYGIVSAVGRRGVTGDPKQEFLQTDASINPGNSGGPLIDVHGSIMGITTAIATRGAKGIGFAIPSNTARRVCEQILTEGEVESGYLGMVLQDAFQDSRPDPSQISAAEQGGALVRAVAASAPASLAGIQPGDVILAFDGERIADASQLSLLVAWADVGSDVPVELFRQEKKVTLTVRVGRRPRSGGR